MPPFPRAAGFFAGVAGASAAALSFSSAAGADVFPGSGLFALVEETMAYKGKVDWRLGR